ncbi:Nam protein 1, putative [Theobroma cacao]|uniref:Nam protein 1, putative n=1 Tax=Theobroma cacao TaxID=3641 RepID=A0A061DZT7_THECC|nr:Nam protein 1, putative [Theobroma cacao]
MNYVKGFRFHPTDAEAIEHLWDKRVLDRDSIVQVGDFLVPVITQLEDICEFQPWELPGRSELEAGDNLWYFFCSPKYKYRNSTRKNRVTREGYWKPTGTPREILTTYNGQEIRGSRQTLVFYRGRVSDQKKNENKTQWVIHEFEIPLNLPNQKSIALCRLKKKYGKVDVSRGEEGQSSHSLPPNLENQATNNAIPKDQLNSNEPLTQSEAFNEYSGNQTTFTTNEQDDDEFVDSLINNDEINTEQRSNQPFFVDENEGPKLPSNFPDHAADDDIPNNQEDFGGLVNQKPLNDCVETLNSGRTSEHDNSSQSSIFIPNDQTTSIGGGNQQATLLAENESSSLAFENHVAESSVPMEHSEFDKFLREGLFMAELSHAPEGVEYYEFSANEQDDEFWNKICFTTDEVLGSKQQNLAESFNFSSVSTMEPLYDPCPMESSRKRLRIESERLNRGEDIEAAPSQE